MSALSPTQPWVAPSTPAQADDGQAHICPWEGSLASLWSPPSPHHLCAESSVQSWER